MKYLTIYLRDGSMYHNVISITDTSINKVIKIGMGYTRVMRETLLNKNSINEMATQDKYIKVN